MNQRDINRKMGQLLGEEQLYDVRCEFRIIAPSLSLEDAQAYYEAVEPENKQMYAITSCSGTDYCTDLNEALRAAKKVAQQNENTFVLSIEDGEWRAAFGDYLNCSEYHGGNPAYVTCQAVLKFMGKL